MRDAQRDPGATTAPDITAFSDHGFLLIKLSGNINRETLKQLSGELNLIEAEKEHCRYLIYVEDILAASIKSEDAMLYRNELRERQLAGRAAFCVSNELQFGMARMFQTILESDLLEIEIFRSMDAAARWLDLEGPPLEAVLRQGAPWPTR